MSDIDCEQPDFVRSPGFCHATVLDVTISPGEVLFIPVGWSHHVRALDPSISVSFTNFAFSNNYRWLASIQVRERSAGMTILSQPWTHHQPQPHPQDARQYHTRVRRRVYLWGSAGIHHDVRFSPAPVLHLWNDVFGTPIAIGTRKADGQERALGTLQPGSTSPSSCTTSAAFTPSAITNRASTA